MTEGHTHCEWVQKKLALLAGENDGLGCGQGELISSDLKSIDNHLVDCTSCRNYRASLEEVMDVLESSAAEPWTKRSHSSLWLELEQRIKHPLRRQQPFWQRLALRIFPKPLQLTLTHLVEAFETLRMEAPLRFAWTYDSLLELLERKPWGFQPKPASDLGGFLEVNRRQLLGSFCLMAGIVFLVLTIAVAHRVQVQARPQLAVNSPSPKDSETSTQDLPEQTMDVIIATKPVTQTRTSDSLLQTASSAPVEPTALHPQPPMTKALTTATAEATSAPTSPPRYNFYLERGAVTPPETRGTKAAY